jgi:PPOX class probable F420-dependent enzyme
MSDSLDERLALVRRIAGADNWLGVLVTTNAAGEPQVSVVNAGLLPHPVTGEPYVAVVAVGRSAKLRNLRRRPRAMIVFRAGWEWVAVEGPCELAGPDDPLPGLAPDQLPRLLRDIYHAAGGHHPDLAEYDRVMAAERRTAVLIAPARIITNPSTTADNTSAR